MSKLLNKIALTRLRKLELPHFAKQVLKIVSKHDAETLLIKETFDMLEGLEPLIAYLEDRYGPHPLTKKMDALHKERIKSAVLIVDQMKVYIKADKAAMRSSIEIVEPEVNRALDKLQKNGQVLISGKIGQLFERIDSNEHLELAFSDLKLTEYLNDLRNANSSYMEMEDKRITSIGERPKISIPPIVLEVNAALRNLLSQIELARTRNPEVDYLALIQELNVSIASFVGKINQRAALNKKKSEVVIESKEGAETTVVTMATSETSGLPTRFTASTNRMSPEKVELEIEGKHLAEKEKAAAMWSKTLQLPDLNDENQK